MIKKSIGICFLFILLVSGCAEVEDERKYDIITKAIERLAYADEQIRREASSELVKLSQESNAVVPALEKALLHEDALIRAGAADTIGRINPDLDVIELSLAALLDDKEIEVRLSAARALGVMSDDAREVLPVILEGMRHFEPRIRLKAVHALVRFGPEVCAGIPEVIPELIDMFEDTDTLVAKGAASAIWQFGDKALPYLIYAVQDDSPTTRVGAVFALKFMGEQAAGAIPALLEAAKSASPEFQFDIAVTISYIDPGKAETLVPSLINGLETGSAGKDRNKIHNAARALAVIGPPAVDAVPALVTAIESVDDSARVDIVYALTQVSAEHLDLGIDYLIMGLDSEDQVVRLMSAMHLGEIGPAASRALPKLRELSETEQEAMVLNVVSGSIKKIERDG